MEEFLGSLVNLYFLTLVIVKFLFFLFKIMMFMLFMKRLKKRKKSDKVTKIYPYFKNLHSDFVLLSLHLGFFLVGGSS